MHSLPWGELSTVLCLGSHADDIEIGCGGTILQLIRQQPHITVHWVVFSSHGERAAEARDSAQRFLQGAASNRIVIHDFRDTFFPQVWGPIKEAFGELQRDVRPDLVFTHRREDLHQDHRVISELTWCTFRNHFILEYEIPKFEGDLGTPNFFVPIDEEICRRKIDQTLDAFASQRVKPWFSPDTFWALLRIRGVECNSPTRFAEGHYCRKAIARA